jgi:hypothetical protein
MRYMHLGVIHIANICFVITSCCRANTLISNVIQLSRTLSRMRPAYFFALSVVIPFRVWGNET